MEKERCVLCLEDEKKSPVFIPCGHSFCSECFERFQTYDKLSHKCPICRCDIVLRRGKKRRASDFEQPSAVDILEHFLNMATDNEQDRNSNEENYIDVDNISDNDNDENDNSGDIGFSDDNDDYFTEDLNSISTGSIENELEIQMLNEDYEFNDTDPDEVYDEDYNNETDVTIQTLSSTNTTGDIGLTISVDSTEDDDDDSLSVFLD